MSRLHGKVALVTGTSPNIGGVVASDLADAGARIACNDVDVGHAEARAATITAAGGDAIAIPFDVTDIDAARVGIETVLERFGQIDLLVNNAVKFDMGGVLDMDLARFRRQVDIIVGGAFIMTKLVAQAMVERRIAGSIVNVLSTAAWQGQAGNVGYCTAKSGLINFTRSVAMELAPHRIRVNSVLGPSGDSCEVLLRDAPCWMCAHCWWRSVPVWSIDCGHSNPRSGRRPRRCRDGRSGTSPCTCSTMISGACHAIGTARPLD